MNNDNTTQTITHISLCSGYGGIDIGLKRAIPNLRTIAYSEIEAFPVANLVSKMEAGYLDAAPIWTDLKTFPWQYFYGKVGILSGGFPCQPFSSAGKRNADNDERHLFPYILEGIKICRPGLVFLENVEGIISAKLCGDGWRDPEGTPVLLHVLRELERVGYKATAGVFSASEVGAPHQRKRVFILGYSTEYGIQGQRSSKLTKSFSYDGEGLPSSTGKTMVNTNSNGGREVGEICQGANGSVIECNGEEGRIELAHSEDKRCRGRSDRDGNDSRGISEQETQFKSVLRGEVEGCCRDTRETLWPSRPGQQQYWWEPPRVVGKTSSIRLECPRNEGGLAEEGKRTKGKRSKSTSTLEESSDTSVRETTINEVKSEVGRGTHGPSSGMVLAELYTTSDSRNDELRLLGNGVVPQTCTKAFITLLNRIAND